MSCFQKIQDLIHDAEDAIDRHESIEDLETEIYAALGQCDELEGVDPDGLAVVVGDYLQKLHGEAEPNLVPLSILIHQKPPEPDPIEWQPG